MDVRAALLEGEQRHRRPRAQRVLDRVGQRALLAADRGDVDKGGGEGGAIGVQVKVVIHGNQPTPRAPGLGEDRPGEELRQTPAKS